MTIWKIKTSLFLNYIVFAILLNSVGAVILQVINHYHINKAAAGNLDAYKDITIAIFSFIAASFLPRLGYKISMLIGLAIISVTCYLTPIINEYWMIKFLLVSVGVGFALIKVSAYSTVGLITKNEQEHASFVSILEGVFMFGVLGGFWLFGLFIRLQSTNWLDTYWVIGILASVAFLLLATTTLDESETVVHNSRMLDDFIIMIKLNKELLIMIFVISIFMYVFIEQGITTWLPTFNNKVLHINSAMSIEMASIFSAAIALGRLTTGFILKRIPWFKLLIIYLIVAGLMIIFLLPEDTSSTTHLVSSWHDIGWVAYVFPLIGFFLASIYPTLCSTMVSTLPKHRHSAMMGLIMIFSALGGALGSKMVGLTFQTFGGHFAIAATLVPIIILSILLFPYKHLRKQAITQQVFS